MLSVIKEEYKTSLVAFNGKGRIVLGQRDDLDVLALMAIKSQNRRLLNMFEKLPTEKELRKALFDAELKKGPAGSKGAVIPIKVPDTAKAAVIATEPPLNK